MRYWINYTYYPNHGDVETKEGYFNTEVPMVHSEGIETMRLLITSMINARHTGSNGKVHKLIINNFKFLEE